jgi:Cu2+-exporting ATPase
MANLLGVYSLKSSEATTCLHCGQLIPKGRTTFCCNGCQVVYAIIKESGLERFYQLRPSRIQPLLGYFTRQTDFSWVDRLAHVDEGSVNMDIEGIQCSACIWAIGELAKRQGLAQVHVDASVGKLSVNFVPEQFDLKIFLKKLQNLGYRTSLPSSEVKKGNSSLLVRLGICMAIAMNTMFLSISLYLGLGRSEPELFELFTRLNFYLSLISVIVGGSYFFNRAFYALKNRVLHFDLPVSIGILAAFIGSTQAYLQHNQGNAYFDTLNIFITLMLLGRFLQARTIQRNRNALLDKGSLENFSVTRLMATIDEIPFSQVKESDILLIQPGGIVPVNSVLENPEFVECSLEWISGESSPVVFKKGQTLAAGAHLLSSEAVTVKAQLDFKSGALAHLSPTISSDDSLPVTWQWTTKWYVATVLTLAFSGLLAWHFIDPSRALGVFVAVLVVTCPCSLGIAIPLARTIANRALMQNGIFARSGKLLDQCLTIRKIFFDKTGTLTLSSMTLVNPEALAALSPDDLGVLYNASARSRHPASHAIYEFLRSRNLALLDCEVTENPGEGLAIKTKKGNYFLGRNRLQSDQSSEPVYEVHFFRNSIPLITLKLRESVLEDARSVLAKLMHSGHDVYLVSGDKNERVLAMAKELNIPPTQAFSACLPQQKADLITKLGSGDTLMIGDGLNDSLAFEKASLCGAPVWERSVLARRADFFFTAGHLRWLPKLFDISKKLESTINANLVFSAIYNLGTVSLALAGLMSPLLCAIFMPVGSLMIISWTVGCMRRVI